VALIGFPDAASRAALILALVALSLGGGRPPARWGALAAALVVLLAVDPAKLAGPGFQLSFLGAAGLVAWSGAVTRWIGRLSRGKCPDWLASALGAGIAATLATLPVVAWHFERVSVVGIPVTIVATPLVSLALPGAILSLLLDPIAPWAAAFLAGGVDALLAALEALTRWAGAWSWASVWTTRTSVLAGLAGCGVGWAIARHPRIRGGPRRALLGAYVCIAVVGWPLVTSVQGWGTLEVLVIDVGQGDAIALRSPRGRWMLVDAGPPARGPAPDTPADPGAHPAVRGLRARGVSRLEALVLTHADSDHIGGAAAVLTAFTVGAVYDPALPAGKAEYVDVLETAAAHGIPWVPARAGLVIDFDGARVEVLSPADSLPADVETNEASVVLRVSFGDFDALLTGDAYKDTERQLAPGLAGLELLKVGHHGSDTSTDSLLLALAAPELAVIPVGRFNRYGHPHPDVLGRLERAGVEVRRTDLEGTLSITAWRDGSWEAVGERGPL
jgi:competence protein ComEC